MDNLDSWFSREANNSQICFLCGINLNAENTSKEHIFPKWILKKFNLFDKPLTLLNETNFRYRQFVIPCCLECYNESLSQLELEIQNSVNKGFESFLLETDELSIYKWCQLLFYKILYKENFLNSDIKDQNSEKIVTDVQFDSMKLNHLFLRSIDKKVNFSNFFPGSIFICKLKTSPDDSSLNFDYLDSIPQQCLGIRLNDIGIIVVLSDSGIQKIITENEYNEILSKELAPIQFRNLFAKVVYRQMLFNDPYTYEIELINNDEAKITQKIKPNFDGNVYEQGNSEDYLKLLGSVFKVNPEEFRLSNGDTGSLFYDKFGKWKDREFNDDGTKEKTE